MSARRLWAGPQLWGGLAAAAVAVSAGGAELGASGRLASAAWAALAGLVAAAVAGLAVSLPGITWRGLVFGGLFVGAGILSWTYTDRPAIVWGVLLVEGLLFLAWSWPWLARLRTSTRMGTAWLGTSYWILGVVGALLTLHAAMAAQRLLYAGVFGLAVLAVLAVLAKDARDLSVGIAAAFLIAIAVLILVGSGNLFQAVHVVPANDWGKGFEYRFWGGHWLLYHPNSMAGIAVLAAIRIGPDRAFAGWQRLGVLALAGFIISVANSRTGFIFLAAAAIVHAALWWRRRRHPVAELPVDRRSWATVATPFVVLALVLVSAHGVQFLTQDRYGADAGVSSGRVDTWKQVITDWRHAGLPGKAFGDTQSVRSTVYRQTSGSSIKLTVDNALFGALRHGGALGVLAFLVGLGLLLRNVWRRRADVPAWYALAVLSALPTIATTEWLLGGTGGTMWILLVAGEARLLTVAPGGRPESHSLPRSTVAAG
jgi:hypothetical protein